MPAPTPIVVNPDQRKELRRLAQASTTSQREAFRARLILGLADAPGRGRKIRVSATASGKALTLAPTPAPHGGAWSVREMARQTGLEQIHRPAALDGARPGLPPGWHF